MMGYHHLSIDVEEYFHPTALEGLIPRDRWDRLPRRTPELVRRILDHFSEREVVGTFFVLGWLAKREPEMVREISEAGHEIACHGWDHRRVTSLSTEDFHCDLRRSREVLQDLTGQPVVGYRAPSFSIVPGFEWALDVLLQEGFEYDSSMFPVSLHPGYGYPQAGQDPFLVERELGSLVEVPPATLSLGRLRIPAAGGAYLRFFPPALVSAALKAAEGRGVPGTVYLHPWEVDKSLPPLPGPWATQLRMRVGVGRAWPRLSKLTSRFRFRPIRETVFRMRKETTGPTR